MPLLAESLDGMAALAASRAELERAVRLGGATDALRECIGAPLHAQHRAGHERWLDLCRRVLGEAAVAETWALGRALSPDEAVDLALAGSNASSATGTPPTTNSVGSNSLSPREREIAGLLAKGLSNRQIAESLVITERTVAAHIEHILDKLGFNSRTQIAPWAAADHSLAARDHP